MESIFGVTVDPAVRALRRLFYCGEWIESHLLHMVFLAAPDYLGLDDGIAVAKLHPAEVERSLRLRKLGNRILKLLGGRPVNPVGACIGGFSRAPLRAEMSALAADLRRGAWAKPRPACAGSRRCRSRPGRRTSSWWRCRIRTSTP